MAVQDSSQTDVTLEFPLPNNSSLHQNATKASENATNEKMFYLGTKTDSRIMGKKFFNYLSEISEVL